MRKVITVATVISVAILMPASADATFPARNGKLAFKRYLDPSRSTSAILVSDPNGKRERQLTHPSQGIRDDQPDWSPDGARIAFQRCSGPGTCEVWTMSADGTGQTRLGPDCLNTTPPACESRIGPVYSPSGTIGFGRGYGDLPRDAPQHAEADVMSAHGGSLRTIWAAGPYSITAGSAAWAPNGKQLVLALENSRYLKPRAGRPPGGIALYVINANGSGKRRITPFSLRGGDSPDWAPDGKRILFRSRADSTGKPVGSQLYTVRPDGTGLKQLSHFKPGTVLTSSSFSPDGKWITVGLSGIGGQPDVYVMRADGTGARPVTRTSLWDSAPDWGPAR
jgi:TolB protein